MHLREYQKTYIYDPIVEIIDHNLLHDTQPQFRVLGLSTSAGKTFTITNFCAEYCFAKGCDVIITSPNAASLEEIKNTIKNSKTNPYIVMANGFAGETTFQPPQTDRQVVVLCHPTYLSQNTQEIDNWSKERRVVIFSDEAHQGFMCSGPEDTELAYGYSISDYEAAWHKCLYGISHVAWFLFSATPLKTTEHYDTFDIISEYFDRGILCDQQAAVSRVVFYGDKPCSLYFNSLFCGEEFDSHGVAADFVEFDSSELDDCIDAINNRFMEGIEWLAHFNKKYSGFPKAKPAMAVQAKDTSRACRLFKKLGDCTAIAVDRNKAIAGKDSDFYLRQFDDNVTSQKIFEYIEDKNTEAFKLVANKAIGNAVNISNLSSLVSYHDRPSVKDWDITTAVEQILGRMVRFPKIEGINNWHDLIDFAETKISAGVPREDVYRWIDLVFRYEVHMVSSDNNFNGVARYYSKQSYNPIEWQTYIEGLITSWHNEKSQQPARNGGKTPHAQKGDQSYKNYKNIVRECEYCPKIKVGDTEIPGCKLQVLQGVFTEEVYHQSLDVHHIHGREDIATMNDYDNLMTVCKPAHNTLDQALEAKKC